MGQEEVKKTNYLTYVLIAVGIGLLVFIIYLILANHRLQDDKVALHNELAEKDSLHRVLLKNNHSLSEKYSILQENFEDVLDSNQTLKDFIEEKGAEIISLVSTINRLKLDNMELRGVIKEDSAGIQVVDYDTATAHYSMQLSLSNLEVRISRPPKLNINSLVFIDSSYIGYYEQEHGFITGFITHSNPFIVEDGTEFRLAIDESKHNFGFNIKTVAIVGVSGIIAGYILRIITR